jgi:hypothetical protein
LEVLAGEARVGLAPIVVGELLGGADLTGEEAVAAARTSRYSSSLASGSRKFASNGVFVYAGSMTETRMPLVRSSWSSDSE